VPYSMFFFVPGRKSLSTYLSVTRCKYTTIKQMMINCKRTSKAFRLLTAWYINLNCFSIHQLQWKWFPSLLPKIIKIKTIYYGFSYSITSKSCENTTSSNMSWIFMLIIWIHYFIHHIYEYLNNILNLNTTFIF
jgi:hypothetical protein